LIDLLKCFWYIKFGISNLSNTQWLPMTVATVVLEVNMVGDIHDFILE